MLQGQSSKPLKKAYNLWHILAEEVDNRNFSIMQEHNKKERQGDVVFEIRETTMEGWEAAWMLQDHAQKLRNA